MLDREKHAFYNLTVVAIDVTRPGVRTETYVVVKVDDISDAAPHFTQLVYNISVSESAAIGTQLLKVHSDFNSYYFLSIESLSHCTQAQYFLMY